MHTFITNKAINVNDADLWKAAPDEPRVNNDDLGATSPLSSVPASLPAVDVPDSSQAENREIEMEEPASNDRSKSK